MVHPPPLPPSLPPSKVDLIRLLRVSLRAGPAPALRLPRVSIKEQLLFFIFLQCTSLDGLVAAGHRALDLQGREVRREGEREGGREG